VINREMTRLGSEKIDISGLVRSLETLSFYGFLDVKQHKLDVKNALVLL